MRKTKGVIIIFTGLLVSCGPFKSEEAQIKEIEEGWQVEKLAEHQKDSVKAAHEGVLIPGLPGSEQQLLEMELCKAIKKSSVDVDELIAMLNQGASINCKCSKNDDKRTLASQTIRKLQGVKSDQTTYVPFVELAKLKLDDLAYIRVINSQRIMVEQ